MLRNRHAGDVAALLTALSLEDQVVVFRVLPRKDAAAVFEYLSRDAQEALLKAMAQEDVAALRTTWRRTTAPCSSRSSRQR
jgi:Mg/Co/Ni transporter MgtE